MSPRRRRTAAARSPLVAALFVAALLGARPARGEDSSRAPTEPVHTNETGTLPAFRPIRYQEDYAHLARRRREGWDAIKYVPLGGDAYVSFGGQHRLRYEIVDPVDVGVGTRKKDSGMLSRNLVHADLHLGPSLRVFAQVGAFFALDAAREEAEPPDANDLDATQLFVETRAEIAGVRLVGRAGRQEMALGSTRWVGTRDGTNVRQAFDLVRMTVSAPSGATVETFFGTAPELRRGVFDDAPALRDGFWGSYATIPVVPKKLLSVEAFYLGRRRAEARYAEVSGREVRHTFGVRVFGQTSFGLEYVEHAMVQVGAIDERSIAAWALASALWQRLPAPLERLRLGVRSDALSGDSSPADGTLRTFHPLFPNQTFFSALPAIYPQNLYDVHPLVRFESESVSLEAGCVFFFRQSTRDAVYAPPGSVLVDGATTDARSTAAQGSLSLAYRAGRNLAVNAEYSRIFAGPAITAAGGRDVDFFGTWTTFTY